MDNYLSTQLPPAEFSQMWMGVCSNCTQQFWQFTKKYQIGNGNQLPYNFWAGAAIKWILTLPWMGSSPVTMISTIGPLSCENSLVLRMGKHSGYKSPKACWVNFTFLPGECQKAQDIPIIVDAYIKHMVGVEVAELYQIYFKAQLIDSCN